MKSSEGLQEPMKNADKVPVKKKKPPGAMSGSGTGKLTPELRLRLKLRLG